MPQALPQILQPFHRYPEEAATLGRLLLNYPNLEVRLLHCVQMAAGGNLNAVLKGMFRRRGETARINRAEQLGHPHFAHHSLTRDFQHALSIMRRCLEVRNQYAHWILWDDHTGKLAFANLERLAKRKRPVNNFDKLRTFHVSATLLAEQEAYYIYCDKFTTWLNFEIRFRSGRLKSNIFPKPKRIKWPRLKLK
jgi:hypothetical protein